MRLLIVSDLHIWGTDDPLYQALIRLVRQAEPDDTIVLAGDTFDLFVGNKPIFVERYREFFDALREADARGVYSHYIEGNHDFLVKKAFTGLHLMQVHSRDVEFALKGKRFFISHGDTVDRTDKGYLALRLFFRSPVMKALVAAAPDRLLEKIGTTMSRKSRGAKPAEPSELPIENFERLRLAYRNYAAEKISHGYDFVVMGHCHDLDSKTFRVGSRVGQYINVGYPRVHGSFLEWRPGDEWITRAPLPG